MLLRKGETYKIRNPMAAGHYVFSLDSFIVPSGKRLFLTKISTKTSMGRLDRTRKGVYNMMDFTVYSLRYGKFKYGQQL